MVLSVGGVTGFVEGDCSLDGCVGGVTGLIEGGCSWDGCVGGVTRLVVVIIGVGVQLPPLC